jgi:hypothetical protein
MKKALLSIIILVVCGLSVAQVPESFNYQAIPRNSSGGSYPDQPMKGQFSILSGSPTGPAVYVETFSGTTSSLGILNLQVGKGTVVSGNFTTINWGNNTYFIKVELDPTGGTNYVVMGTTQLLSVPYALFSKKAQTADYNNLTNLPNLSGYLTTESDPVFAASPANGITNGYITNWNTAYTWGNHAGLYKLITYVPAWNEITNNPFNITTPSGNQLLKYNSSSSKWENFTPGYLTSYTETDPIFGAWNKSTGINITASQVTDFQTSVTNNSAVSANTAKVSNATHSGDATGSTALTVVGINGTSLAGLATGILKNTNSTGIPSIATAGVDYLTPTGSAALLTNFPVLNQNTTGNAETVTTNANLTGDVTSTGNATTIASYAVTTTKIANSAVTASKLTAGNGSPGRVAVTDALGSVSYGNIPAASVSGNNLISTDLTVTGGTGATLTPVTLDIAINAITTTKLADANVTYAKIQNITATDRVLGRISPGSGVVEEIATTGSGNVVRAISPALVTPDLGTPSALVGTNITGTAPGLTAGNVLINANLTGEVTSAGNATTIENSAVTSKVLTGFTILTGPVTSSDNILQAFGKLAGLSSNPHYIGETYGGGIVFYVYDSGHHGLIAATADQSSGCAWYNGAYTSTGALRDGISAGLLNTDLIMTSQGLGNYAALLCMWFGHTYNNNIYGDWYLPSKYELSLLYSQKTTVGGFTNAPYWSSYESASTTATAIDFTNGSSSEISKDNSSVRARAIRAF